MSLAVRSSGVIGMLVFRMYRFCLAVLLIVVAGGHAWSQSEKPAKDADPQADYDVNGRVIYGTDSRKDWHELDQLKNKSAAEIQNIKRLARSSVALFADGNVAKSSARSLKLSTKTLMAERNLCQGETFAGQRVGADCSGVLIATDLVLTAGHCVQDVSGDPSAPKASQLRVVFGFHVANEGGTAPVEVPSSNVFEGKEIVGGEFSRKSEDWAIFRLKKPVPASIATPIESALKKDVATGQQIFVIGYPSGLPLKYAPDAVVRHVDKKTHFVANLDTYGGNSGSPVFDEETNALVGILVRGETDYVSCKKSRCFKYGKCECATECQRSNICPTTGCRGEDVMRVTKIDFPNLPALAGR